MRAATETGEPSVFKALLSERDADKRVASEVVELDESALPEGDVTVDVEYSTLNYKDGLVLSGRGGLVKTWPHVSGIDFAGTVRDSDHPDWSAGDRVILTGWHVGERRWGGHATRARVSGDWLVALPDGLDARRAMAIGTAGLSAMLGIMALEGAGLRTGGGPVLVTGASGGVGSVACALLAAAGHEVEGSTGRAETHDWLRGLGVARTVERDELTVPGGRPLESERWAGCVDAVGGATLAHVLARLRHGGAAAAIGLAGGSALETTVIPFLLRGVSLLGIDSVSCPADTRRAAWTRLAAELPFERFEDGIEEVGLDALPALGERILAGGGARTRGRRRAALSPTDRRGSRRSGGSDGTMRSRPEGAVRGTCRDLVHETRSVQASRGSDPPTFGPCSVPRNRPASGVT